MVFIEQLRGEPGSKVEFTDVLVVGQDGGEVAIGSPYIAGAAVVGELVEHAKGEKTIAHHRVLTNSLGRRRGHRTQYTVVKINSITA